MLNVLVTDIFSVATKDAYQAMNLPLGSSMNLQVKFQNDHAHSFANKIEGISVGIELSHPRVVSASLDDYNSHSLSLHRDLETAKYGDHLLAVQSQSHL